MCGLPPFVDELIDIFIDEGTVFVGVPRLFTRPLRLNSTEAFELLAAGRAAMELPGADESGPLGRGLAKLAAALGGDARVDSGLGEGLDVDLERPEAADQVADAARRLERLRITYWSASRDDSTERVITPRQVYADRGNWYVTATDHRTETLRTFRIDRIETLEPTGDPLALLGQRVRVQWDTQLVRVFQVDTLVAVHARVAAGGFAPRAGEAEASTRQQAFVDRLVGQCERVGPALKQWADAALAARGVRAIRLIQGVLGLTRRHPRERILAAVAEAYAHQHFRYQTIRRLVERTPAPPRPTLVTDDPAIRPMTQYTLEDFLR